MKITIENVQGVVGDAFKLSSFRNGAVKVDIKAMAEGNARGLTDDDKVDQLVAARDALREQGFNASIRLTYKARDGQWRPWSCIWVNPTQTTNEQASARMERLENLVANLAEALTAKATVPDADGDAVVETKEESPL